MVRTQPCEVAYFHMHFFNNFVSREAVKAHIAPLVPLRKLHLTTSKSNTLTMSERGTTFYQVCLIIPSRAIEVQLPIKTHPIDWEHSVWWHNAVHACHSTFKSSHVSKTAIAFFFNEKDTHRFLSTSYLKFCYWSVLQKKHLPFSHCC